MLDRLEPSMSAAYVTSGVPQLKSRSQVPRPAIEPLVETLLADREWILGVRGRASGYLTV